MITETLKDLTALRALTESNFISSKTFKIQKIQQVINIAKTQASWAKDANAALATVTTSATADAGTTAAYTLISTSGVCNLLGAAYTSNGTAMSPVTTTRSDASTFAYSGLIEFYTDSPKVSIGYLTSTLDCLVEIDGTLVSKTPYTRSGSGTQYLILDFSALAVKNRKIRVYSIAPARFINVTTLYRAWALSTDDVVRCVITGDSYTAGTGASSNSLTWASIVGNLLGFRDTRACGIGGTGYLAPATGTAWKCRDHISDVTTPNPDVVIFAHGANDATYTTAAITAEALLCYQTVRASLPNAVIIVLGPWALASGPSFSITEVEGAILAAVTAFNDPLCKFVKQTTDPAGSWITGTGRTGATNGTGNADIYIGGVSGTDTSHPNDSGHLYLARRAANGVAAAIATITTY